MSEDLNTNGASGPSIDQERWLEWVEGIRDAVDVLKDTGEQLATILEPYDAGTIKGSEGVWVREFLQTSTEAIETIGGEAGRLYNLQMKAVGEVVDPREIIERITESTGGHYQDDFARSVWQAHEGCSVDELRAIAQSLGEIEEAAAARLEYSFSRGERGADQDYEAFIKAYYKRPIIDYMAECAALDGPQPPRWDEIRWQDQIRLMIDADSANTTHASLRCMYFLLIQLRRDFPEENNRDLLEAVADLRGMSYRGVQRSLLRGRGKPDCGMEDLADLPSTPEEWAEWLDGKEELRIEL